MAKRRAHASATWREYRKGRKNKTAKHQPILRGEKREHVVSQVMDIMRDWRSSPFENEGAVRLGLRSSFCIDGHGWDRSDQEAAEIIAKAVNVLGFVRPTYEQGQREYVVPRENCAWCEHPLDPTLLDSTFNVRFCSSVCARSALQHRNYETTYRTEVIRRSAWNTIRRERNPVQPCKNCGVNFRPTTEGGEFCSVKCWGHYGRRLPDRDCKQCGTTFRPRNARILFCSKKCSDESKQTLPARACLHCGTSFRPACSHHAGLFCSRACSKAHGQVVRYTKTCDWCQQPFEARRDHAFLCSQTCRNKWNGIKYGKWKPKVMTPPVFDCIMRIAA